MLVPDLKILPLINVWDPQKDLSINGGINVIEAGRYLDGIKTPDRFHCGICRPKDDWRPLSAAETACLVGITRRTNIANTILIVDTPTAFRARFFTLQLDRMSLSPADWEEKMQGDFPRFAEEVASWLEQEIFASFPLFSAFVNFTNPRLDTTTFDTGQGRYRGLHIDNWGEPLRNAIERDASGIRVCINLGSEKRDLVFVNLRLRSFLDQLAKRRGNENTAPLYLECYAQPLAEDFLAECTDYPLVKLSLAPGHAYIGPVQNMIHDGYTRFKKTVDINLQLSANQYSFHQSFIEKALVANGSYEKW